MFNLTDVDGIDQNVMYAPTAPVSLWPERIYGAPYASEMSGYPLRARDTVDLVKCRASATSLIVTRPRLGPSDKTLGAYPIIFSLRLTLSSETGFGEGFSEGLLE